MAIASRKHCSYPLCSTWFGGMLSWEYLRFVREHPITWDIPTEILYGGGDGLVPRQTVDRFVHDHRAGLTIMEEGGHWFHTDEQVAFLGDWMRAAILA
ncbi:alpha/beta hydrolase [Coriobacteriales bacterium OH1046]|nr:alpha/beta hydrolase [Coriobacteriales bacterium OH1046]